MTPPSSTAAIATRMMSLVRRCSGGRRLPVTGISRPSTRISPELSSLGGYRPSQLPRSRYRVGVRRLGSRTCRYLLDAKQHSLRSRGGVLRRVKFTFRTFVHFDDRECVFMSPDASGVDGRVP